MAQSLVQTPGLSRGTQERFVDLATVFEQLIDRRLMLTHALGSHEVVHWLVSVGLSQ